MMNYFEKVIDFAKTTDEPIVQSYVDNIEDICKNPNTESYDFYVDEIENIKYSVLNHYRESYVSTDMIGDENISIGLIFDNTRNILIECRICFNSINGDFNRAIFVLVYDKNEEKFVLVSKSFKEDCLYKENFLNKKIKEINDKIDEINLNNLPKEVVDDNNLSDLSDIETDWI